MALKLRARKTEGVMFMCLLFKMLWNPCFSCFFKCCSRISHDYVDSFKRLSVLCVLAGSSGFKRPSNGGFEVVNL